MSATEPTFTGGCQCGAVRFSAQGLGRSSICHCRMCQKATGSFFGAFVTGRGVQWTRGAPKHFLSSNKVRRGFCGACGTPLTYEQLEDVPAGQVELAVGALDRPAGAPPVIQVGVEDKLSFFDGLAALPVETERSDAWQHFLDTLVSHQHPDHDTDTWPPAESSTP